jgi:hypothetical protein
MNVLPDLVPIVEPAAAFTVAPSKVLLPVASLGVGALHL